MLQKLCERCRKRWDFLNEFDNCILDRYSKNMLCDLMEHKVCFFIFYDEEKHSTKFYT